MLPRSRTFGVFLVLTFVVTATIAIHLLPGLDSSRLENGIRNGLHFILFAIIAAFTFQMVASGPAVKFLVAISLVIATGCIAEFAQYSLGGMADIRDIYRDVSGAATILVAMLVYSASRKAEKGSIRRYALKTGASAIALLVFLPVAFWTSALLFERSRHPIVQDFDSRYSRYRIVPINAEVTLIGATSQGKNMLAELVLSKRGRSGLAIQTAKYDWSNETTLVFTAEVVEGSTSRLTVHINDGTNLGKFIDTESGTVTLVDGKQEYRVPVMPTISEAQRGDDLTNIRQLVILARDKQAGARLQLDDIRLE